jgi:hypothetical protein
MYEHVARCSNKGQSIEPDPYSYTHLVLLTPLGLQDAQPRVRRDLARLQEAVLRSRAQDVACITRLLDVPAAPYDNYLISR